MKSLTLLLLLFLSNLCFAEINDSPPSDKNVRVGVALYIDNLSNVSPEIETVEFEFRFILNWVDKRLAFSSLGGKQKPKIYRRAAALDKLKQIWFPPYTFIDSRGEVKSKGEQLIIEPDGHVTLMRRINAEIETTLNMQRFPFDTQMIEVRVTQLLLSENNIVYVADNHYEGFDKTAELPEWNLLRYETGTQGAGKEYFFKIHLQHNSTFYIFRVLIPFIIIIILSWSVYWLPQEILSHRLQFVLTTLLATLIFQWVIFKDIPHVAYPTFFGELLFFSYITLALTIFYLVAASLINKPLAAQINYYMRWFVAIFYLIGVTSLLIFNFM